MQSHSACPVALPLAGSAIRIYFGTRDADNHPSVGYVTVDMNDPLTPLEIADEPVLARGPWGMFDDNGVYPGCLVADGTALRLYYMGRSNGQAPLYYMAIGLATSKDGGRTFKRDRPDPLIARSQHDPWMVSTPYILKIAAGEWLMWYLSGLGWESLDPPVSTYHIKLARSEDGVSWHRNGEVAFDFIDGETNIASPCVWRTGDAYNAVFCSVQNDRGYRLEWATSADAIVWTRTGQPSGLETSDDDWDSDCMAYPSTFVHNDKRYLLYSGNGNGREGFGIARLDEA